MMMDSREGGTRGRLKRNRRASVKYALDEDDDDEDDDGGWRLFILVDA